MHRTVRIRPASRAAPASVALLLGMVGSFATVLAQPATPQASLRLELAEMKIDADVRLLRHVATPADGEPVAQRRSFWDDRMMPRLERRLGHLTAIHLERDATGVLAQDMFYEMASRSARRGLEHAAKNALEELLIDETVLGKLKRRATSRVKSEPDPSKRPKSTSFGFGLSHGLPEVEIDYKRSGRMIRFSVEFEGSVGVELRGRNPYSRIGARYDLDEGRYTIGCLFNY